MSTETGAWLASTPSIQPGAPQRATHLRAG
jgi:hypothetical protein